MSKSSRRAKRNKVRKRRAKAEANRAWDPGMLSEMPRPLRLAIEKHEQFVGLLAANDTIDEAASSLDAQLRDKVARLVAEVEMWADPMLLLDLVRANELLVRPGEYRETEHEGLAAKIELTAIAITYSTPSSNATERADVVPADVERVTQILQEVVELGSMRQVLQGLASESWSEWVGSKAATQQVFLRNRSYPHMQAELTEELIRHAKADELCTRTCGFTPSLAADLLAALNVLHTEEINAPMHRLMESLRPAYDLLKAGVSLDEIPRPDLQPQDLLPERSAFSVEELQARLASPVGRDEIREAVRLLSFLPAENSCEAEIFRFFDGANPLEDAPVVDDGCGRVALVHDSFSSSAVKAAMERCLKRDQSAWNLYSDARGELLERKALEYLQALLNPDLVRNSMKFLIPGESDNASEPAGYTKLVESDGLLVLDDVAFAVECKAAPLSPLGRVGDPRALSNDLRKIVTDASTQANRLRDRIELDGGVRLRSGEWLDLGHVVEVHSIVVSYEDLAFTSAATSDLIGAGVIDYETLPWVISINDLRTVSELSPSPASMLIYLRRRLDRLTCELFAAIDELDFFMAFLEGGFFAEPDPDARAAEVPAFGEVKTAQRRRFREQPAVFLTSRTDPLDAWYAGLLGQGPPTPKPLRDVHPFIDQVQHALRESGVRGWLSVSAALEDLGHTSAEFYSVVASELPKKSRRTGRPHSVTWISGSRASDSMVVAFATRNQDGTAQDDLEMLAGHIKAKRFQTKVPRAAALLIDDSGRLIDMCFASSADPVDSDVANAALLLGEPGAWDDRGRIRRHLKA